MSSFCDCDNPTIERPDPTVVDATDPKCTSCGKTFYRVPAHGPMPLPPRRVNVLKGAGVAGRHFFALVPKDSPGLADLREQMRRAWPGFGADCGATLDRFMALIAPFLKCEREQAELQGWQKAIAAVRASLEAYPNGGGDAEIMAQVERIKALGSRPVNALCQLCGGPATAVVVGKYNSLAVCDEHKALYDEYGKSKQGAG